MVITQKTDELILKGCWLLAAVGVVFACILLKMYW